MHRNSHHIQIIGFWEMPLLLLISNFHTQIKDKYLEHFLWNCPQVNAIRLHWWLVNIGSGNGLVSSGNNPLPEQMLSHNELGHNEWTHSGQLMHICISKLSLTIIGSNNGLSPGRCWAIILTNAGILLIGPLGTNFNDILIEIHTFSFKKMYFKMSSAKWWPFCLGLNVLIWRNHGYIYNSERADSVTETVKFY